MMSIGDVVRYVPGITVAPGREQPRPGHHPRQQLVGRLLRQRRARRRAVLPRPLQPRARRGAQGAERDDLRPRRRRRRDQPRHQGSRLPAAARGRRCRAARSATSAFTADLDQPLERQGRVPPQRHVRELRQLPRRRRASSATASRPTVTFAPSDRTKITLGYEYLHDGRVADRGITSFQGRPADVDHRHLLRQSRRQPRAAPTSTSASATVEHRVGGADDPQPHARSATTIASIRTSCPARSTPTRTQVALTAYNNATDRTNVFNQTDVIYPALDRPRPAHAARRRGVRPPADRQLPQHRLLQQHGDVDPGAVREPDDRDAGHVPPERDRRRQPPARRTSRPRTRRIRSSCRAHVQVVGRPALRSLRPRRTTTTATATRCDRADNLVSPRAGVVVKPIAPVSVYGSYSVSYLPSSGDQFSSLTDDHRAGRSRRSSSNYEVGVEVGRRRRLCR